MTRAAELEHLNEVGAGYGIKVLADGDGYTVAHRTGGAHVPSLAAAGLLIGGLVMASAELQAQATVAAARYGIGAGNRAQRRAKGVR